MDKTQFYRILDIDSPDEFIYYENVSSLLEEDDFIEENLIVDLFRNIDMSVLSESTENYFEEFLKNIPDEETSLYITAESIKRGLTGMIQEDPDEDSIRVLAQEIVRFRKWYVQDALVFDKTSGTEISVRDARYNIQASAYIDEVCDYDFRLACDYEIDGYDIRISDLVDAE